MRRALAVAALLAFVGAAPADAAFTEQKQLTAADAGTGDFLGRVDASGDTLVAISPSHDNGQNVNPGAVYVFQRTVSGWAHAKQTAELTLPDGAGPPTDAVISGDTIAVAAAQKKFGANPDQGAVFIFVKPASGWQDAQPSAELTASDGARDDEFGFRVALSGDTLVASAPFHTTHNNIDQGTAYVFVKPASGWASAHETAKLAAGDGFGNDLFGTGLAMEDDTIVAGAPGHKVGNNLSQGQAYVFVKPSTGWATRAQDAKLALSNGIAEEQFGSPIAVSGDTVAIGNSSRNGSRGAVDVFVKPSQGWVTETQTAELTASDGAANDHLGDSVSVSGDRILAGAAFGDAGHGGAYLFERPGMAWMDTTETQRLTAADGAPGDLFGLDSVLSGNLAFISAPRRALGGRNMAGGAYVFGRAPSITLNAPADGATFTQGDAVAASYSCSAAADATIASCAGPVADGAPIDTSSPGSHTFALNAVDSDGIVATKSVTYTVVAKDTPPPPPPPPPPPKAPAITALKQSAAVWREGGELARIAGKRKRPIGTTFTFRLDQPAQVTLRFARRGRPAGSLAVDAHTGLNRIRFQGRVSRKKTLAPGRYTLRITATNSAGQRTTSRALSFAIVRR